MTTPVYCAPRSTLTAPYFGRPGAMMLLPQPDGGVTRPSRRAVSTHDLLSGGTATTRRPDAKRAYGLAWSQKRHADAEIVRAHYLGVYGPGPYCLLDPTERNHLDLDVSTMGRRGLGDGWVAIGSAGGTAVYDPTVAPPAAAASSGVLRWSGAAAGGGIGAGVMFGATFDADPLSAPVYVAGVPITLSVYAAAATGAPTITPVLHYRNGDGTLLTSTAQPAVALAAAWQRITVTATPATSGAKYVTLGFTVAAAGPDVLLAGAQCEYGVSAPRAFLVGQRVPRVTFDEGDGRSSTVHWRLSNTYALLEL